MDEHNYQEIQHAVFVLARALIESKRKTIFQVVGKSDEGAYCLVIAVQTDEEGVYTLGRLFEPNAFGLESHVVAGPIGKPCPVCKGSGRVSF
jgi:hypothetical protein